MRRSLRLLAATSALLLGATCLTQARAAQKEWAKLDGKSRAVALHRLIAAVEAADEHGGRVRLSPSA